MSIINITDEEYNEDEEQKKEVDDFNRASLKQKLLKEGKRFRVIKHDDADNE